MADEDEIVDALDDIAKIWKSAHDAGVPQKLADLLRRKKHGTIMLLGSTGTGKSNIIKSLNRSAELVDPISIARRTQSPERHKVRVGNDPFVVIDTPGQDAHRHQRSATIRDSFREGDLRVINVVANGYHEYPTAQGALDVNGDAVEDYLKRHREQEEAAALEWLPLVANAGSTKWILTIVAKADLWWDRQAEVLDHYSIGSYGTLVRSYDERVHHIVLPYCSVIHRFFSEGRVSGQFDDNIRTDINLHLIEQLLRLG